MTEKVIFIDIDGVLLSLEGCKSPENAALLKARPDGFMAHLCFDAEPVKLIVELADDAGAKLVLSSNWRRVWGGDGDALMTKLAAEGLREDLWHEDWYLPVLGLEPRKFDEIADWLNSHPPCFALVIDDEGYRGPPLIQGMAGVIVTDESVGYTASDDEAARIFFGVQASEAISTEDAAAHDEPAAPDPYAPEREALMRGEPSMKPIGAYLREIGCKSFPPGQSVLWYKGDGPDEGHWLFAIAPAQEGHASSGYTVTLAFGREKAGSIELKGCVLLNAEDRHGSRIVFNKGCLVRQQGGKFIPEAELKEFDALGHVLNAEFYSNPWFFAE